MILEIFHQYSEELMFEITCRNFAVKDEIGSVLCDPSDDDFNKEVHEGCTVSR